MSLDAFSSAELSRFRQAVGVPDFLEPWLDRFFEAEDVELVLACLEIEPEPFEPEPFEPEPFEPEPAVGGGVVQTGLSPEQIRAAWIRAARLAPPAGEWSVFLDRAHRRGIIDFLPAGPGAAPGDSVAGGRGGLRVRLADFHDRYEIWALFEGWKDVPEQVRRRLNAWEFAAYRERTRPHIEARLAGREDAGRLENEQYLLLHEAKALVERVDHVYLWPCNCRAMAGLCEGPLNVCLRFENNRGIGWEISRERAREVLEEAHRAGLMHTGEVEEVDGRVTGAICNCCADCCFPHQVAEELGAQRLWPRSRYFAVWDPERCTSCGRCTRRCPFGAFTSEGRGEARTVRFAPDLCRGCGLCVSTCREGAIRLESSSEAGPR